MSEQQRQLPHCLAPCWPIVCPDCPFGSMDQTLEESEKQYLDEVQKCRSAKR